MKKSFFLPALFLSLAAYGQTAGPNDPSAAATVPSAACLGCPGEIWVNETDVFLQDNNQAKVNLQQNGFCFQSTCYMSRYLYASGFGFSIPGTATIDGISVDIYREPGTANSTADSTIKLVKNSVPTGQNKAMPGVWSLAPAYYSYGSASDLWGTAWTPADINDPGFGLYMKVYNTDANNVVTPTVDHIRITVTYSTPTGIQIDQSSSQAFCAYTDGDNLLASFVVEGTGGSVRLELFNAAGGCVASKILPAAQAGSYSEQFACAELPQGIYFIRLITEGQALTRKVTLMR
ncbi:MAG: T9SS type A sorting domain-containing protein [Bacteroidota bacterium]